MKTRKRIRKPLVVACQASKAKGPGKGAFDDPPPWQKHEAAFGLFQLDNNQTDSAGCCRLRRFLSRVALIYTSHIDMICRRFLNVCGQIGNLRPLLLIGRRDFERQHVAKRVHCHMPLGSLFALEAVLSSSMAALWCRWNRAPVEDDRTRLALAPTKHPQELAQVVCHRFEDSGLVP